MEILIITCMKNRMYKFENKIRVQSSGGPIGLGLTGEVAECYMLNWDKKFLKKVKDIGIILHVYSRFKDDIFISANSLEKGTKLVEGKLIVDMEKKAEDVGKCDEALTMDIVRQVADEIDPMLKFTIDVPSYHAEGKMPVLDLKVNVNGEKSNRIDFEHYEKPTKNPKILMMSSALNSSTKRTILTQECLRRLRNTKFELGESVRNQHLNQFMLKMKNSGYNQKYRIQILDSALKAFNKMRAEHDAGTKPMYRNQMWNKEERLEQKKNKKINWYKGNEKSEIKYKSILFVPPTPGGTLMKELKKREEELNGKNGERIKITEKGGIKIANILTNKNPFKKERCQEEWCPLYKGNLGSFKTEYNVNNAGYIWVCRTC